jgi:hypothetical protein
VSATPIFQVPDHIPARYVKIRGRGRLCSQQFFTRRRLKSLLMGVEERNAFSWCRHYPQQGAERPTMHHAEPNVVLRLKRQRVNIIPPNGWFAGWHQPVVGVAPQQLRGACCLAGVAID